MFTAPGNPGPQPRIAVLALCAGLVCPSGLAHAEFVVPPSLAALNEAMNHRIVFREDGPDPADEWATPGEVMSRGVGDCEDYAIAKYFALLAAGVPSQRVRLAYVRVLLGGTGDLWRPHLVVAYLAPDAAAGELILDNLLDEIRPLSRRPDLRVLISFDTDGVWSGLERGPPLRRAEQIAPWARLLQRMAAPP